MSHRPTVVRKIIELTSCLDTNHAELDAVFKTTLWKDQLTFITYGAVKGNKLMILTVRRKLTVIYYRASRLKYFNFLKGWYFSSSFAKFC
jgi:hypothetical protein